jgi:hypothetical protein
VPEAEIHCIQIKLLFFTESGRFRQITNSYSRKFPEFTAVANCKKRMHHSIGVSRGCAF